MTTAGLLDADRQAVCAEQTARDQHQATPSNLLHPRLSSNQAHDDQHNNRDPSFQCRTSKGAHPNPFQDDNTIEQSNTYLGQRSQQRTFSIDDDIANRGLRAQFDADNYSDDEDGDQSSDALLAVASAEEYAAKIIKLQQACLIPLKEDLADWLNKILKTSNITTENFMDKLDNGVVICRLAKIISLWCEQQLSHTSSNIHLNSNDKIADAENYGHNFLPISPFTSTNGPLRSATSQSTNCLTSSASATSLNNGALSYYRQSRSNQFLSNLIKMHQTKIWEDAKCRTFYARDNVCNFIKWSKEFGVNQSVLFESDDLVLHANPRQVVLCLLDVARIAYVKYGFTEAPGLVKFEQEIDRELATGSSYTLGQHVHAAHTSVSDQDLQQGSDMYLGDSPSGKKSGRARKSLEVPIDKTDELVMRYCRHKEEEAARKRNEDLELAAAAANARPSSSEQTLTPTAQYESNHLHEELSLDSREHDDEMSLEALDDLKDGDGNLLDRPLDRHVDVNSPSPFGGKDNGLGFGESHGVSSTTCDTRQTHGISAETCRIDSLDSGEGPTESASTGHSSSRMLDNTPTTKREFQHCTSIPVPKKRTSFTPSLVSEQASSMTNSELSSSRSSLFSNPEGTNSTSTHQYGRPIASDLDGKVMRIAKSYYGRKASKDITRLSEGKYKIADRIVFVRLLKGHRVMVRIGGGWDTLENFLFRHKSDPSQVIDPDNLLPLGTKIPYDKSPQVTPTKSRLPYYRRSNSASSTNLSVSNLSVSNYSIISSTTPSHRGSERPVSNSMYSSSVERNGRMGGQRIPNLLTHKGQNQMKDGLQAVDSAKLPQPRSLSQDRQHRIPQLINNSPHVRRPLYHQQRSTTPHLNKYQQIAQRPLASSTAPTASASNLYPVTLTTATLTPSSHLGSTKTLSNPQGKAFSSSKQETIRRFGFSSDSLQTTSSNKSSTQNRHPKVNGAGQRALLVNGDKQ